MKTKKTFYIVMGIEKKGDIKIFSSQHALCLIWAKGMVGVLPVFDSKKAAEEYAGGKFKV